MPNKDEQENIVEQLPYLNELMTAIRNVNDAVLQGKDSREAAENLLSDLPNDWMQEIENIVTIERNKYNVVVSMQNRFLVRGTTQSQKFQAQKNIQIAGNNYSRAVKKTVITLLKNKDLLFKTRKKVEMGELSLYALGEGEQNE